MSFKNLTPQEIRDTIIDAIVSLIEQLPESAMQERMELQKCQVAISAITASEVVDEDKLRKMIMDSIECVALVLPESMNSERGLICIAGFAIKTKYADIAMTLLRPMANEIYSVAMSQPDGKERMQRVQDRFENRG